MFAHAGIVEGREGVGTAKPPRDSKRTSEGMRVIRKVSEERGEKRAQRSDGGAEMEGTEISRSCCSETLLVEKLNLVK